MGYESGYQNTLSFYLEGRAQGRASWELSLRRTWEEFIIYGVCHLEREEMKICMIHKVKPQLCTSRLSARGWQMTLRLNRNREMVLLSALTEYRKNARKKKAVSVAKAQRLRGCQGSVGVAAEVTIWNGHPVCFLVLYGLEADHQVAREGKESFGGCYPWQQGLCSEILLGATAGALSQRPMVEHNKDSIAGSFTVAIMLCFVAEEEGISWCCWKQKREREFEARNL